MNGEIAALNSELNGLSTYFADIFEYETAEKEAEIKEKDDELSREAFKYNNSLDEKEQRYANTILSQNAELRVKYLQITNANFFSKDQLVEMGYYEDVMDCVCGYYDGLSNANAYADIQGERKLAIYLDDYYENIIYLYKVRAGY